MSVVEPGFEPLTIRLQVQFPALSLYPKEERLAKRLSNVQNLREGGPSTCLQLRDRSFSSRMVSSFVIKSQLRTCSVPSQVLGAAGSGMKQTQSLTALSPQVSWGDSGVMGQRRRPGSSQRSEMASCGLSRA